MQITAIKQDAAGWKLIAAQKIHNQPKMKPFKGNHFFFDYKNGLLRQYSSDSHKEINCLDFKSALKYIFSL